MLRQTILAAAAAATVAGFSFAAAAADGPAVTWNHAVWGKPRAFTAGIEFMAKELPKRTNGKFQFNISYGGLSKARETLDGLKLGAFESAHFCNFYHAAKNPTFMIFSLPFLPIGDWDVRIKASDAYYQHPAVKKDMARWDAVPYMSTILPQYEILGRGKEPRNVDDFKGMRIRAGGGVGQAMELLGATRVTVPATETYTLIERGTVDAVSFPYTYAHAAYRIHEVTKWYTSNLQPGTAECPIVFNKTAYDALPADYKKVLEDIKAEAYQVQKAKYVSADEKNIPLFKSKLTEIVYTDAQRAEIQAKVGQPIWDKWVADNKGTIPAQELLDFILAEAKKAAGN